VFKLIDGEFSTVGAYVDILMDDMAYSSYSTAKIKNRSMTFNEGTISALSGFDMFLIICSGRCHVT
jgi:hypothetical protein